ncbi:MAG: hypothetical protein ACKPHU_15715, partial [Planctomycetaceae bacterium]
ELSKLCIALHRMGDSRRKRHGGTTWPEVARWVTVRRVGGLPGSPRSGPSRASSKHLRNMEKD